MKNATDFEILKILGKNIQTARCNNKISLKELSNKTQIRLQYLRKIEKGVAIGISTGHIFKIAEALKIKPSELLMGI